MKKSAALLTLVLSFWSAAALAQSSLSAIISQYSAPITVSTATTTKVVSGVAGQYIYVTHWDVVAAGTGNIQWVYGTGSNCGTGQGSARIFRKHLGVSLYGHH